MKELIRNLIFGKNILVGQEVQVKAPNLFVNRGVVIEKCEGKTYEIKALDGCNKGSTFAIKEKYITPISLKLEEHKNISTVTANFLVKNILKRELDFISESKLESLAEKIVAELHLTDTIYYSLCNVPEHSASFKAENISEISKEEQYESDFLDAL